MPNAQESVPFLIVAAALALIEFAWRKRSGLGYDLGAFGGHIGIMVGVGISRALTGFIIAAVLFAAFSFAPVQWDLSDWRTWVVGFLVLDFFYYWQHRFSHEVRWGWASHSVHHSTNEFTLPASFRLSWLSTFSLSWLVYVPMALMGFSPILITVILAIKVFVTGHDDRRSARAICNQLRPAIDHEVVIAAIPEHSHARVDSQNGRVAA